MDTQTLQLPLLLPSGPDCVRCIGRLQTALAQIKGVSEACVPDDETAIQIAYDPDIVTLSRIQQEANRIGAELAAKIDHQTIEMRDLDCPDCAASIEKAVRRLSGVLWAGANFASAQIYVEFERAQTSLREICRVVEAHGVRACPLTPRTVDELEQRTTSERTGIAWLRENRRLVTLAAMSLLMLLSRVGHGYVSTGMMAAAIVIGGWSTARSGWLALRAGALDMNVLMTLAVLGAAGIGDWLEAASVVWLFNLGNLLQAGAMENTRRSIRGLMSLSPKTARVRRGGVEIDLPVERVLEDDTLLVKPGERIAMDGVIVVGAASIDEAPITGESVPKEKGPGDAVFAGTLNGRSAIEVRVTHTYEDTTLARIIQHVEEAQAHRAPAQQMIDRFARVYTPIVVGLAAAVAVLPPAVWTAFHAGLAPGLSGGIWGEWFLRGLSLLIIACPCALVISTPVAIVTAIGSASRRGVLVKGGAFLEEIGRLRALLYDKTGTLTSGRFRVEEVVALECPSADEILAIAAAVEEYSEHPLATAFADANHARNGHKHLPAEGFEAIPGQGARATVAGTTYYVGNAKLLESHGIGLDGASDILKRREAAGKTAVLLADEQRPLGLIVLADTPRADLGRTVAELESLGIEAQAILTGDNEHVAAAVAGTAGLREWRARLLPEQKLKIVREYQAKYGAVGMVGDGINDAPALATANVGIVMGAAGSDTAMETADVALMSDDLTRLPALIRLSRGTHAVIRQNIVFSLATKLGLIVTAVGVGLPLWLAVAGDVGVSLLVTLNALRLRS